MLTVTTWNSPFIRWWTNILFPPRPKLRPSKDQRDEAARFSRGNIPIQEGLFVTQQELENERKEVANIAFPK